jgi:hypothetical protein
VARSFFWTWIFDKAGNVLSSVKVGLKQQGTETAITDTIYSGSSGVGTVTDNATREITSDGNGVVTGYLDEAGTHIPGYVRIYRSSGPSVDQIVPVFPAPQDIQTRQGPDYVVYLGTIGGSSAYIARSTRGTTNYTHATNVASVINSASSGGTIVQLDRGTFNATSEIDIPTSGVLQGCGGINRDDPVVGTIIVATAAVTNLVEMASRANMYDIQIDGASLATSTVRISGAGCIVAHCGLKRGLTNTLITTDGRWTIHGCDIAGISLGGTSNAVNLSSGADGIMSTCRITDGATGMLVDGGINQFINLHIVAGTSVNGVVRVRSAANQFVNCYYDSADGPLIQIDPSSNISGNYFIGGYCLNANLTDNTQPVFLLAGAADITYTTISGFFCKARAVGTGAFSHFIKYTGAGSRAGTSIDNIQATDCTLLWSTRPTTVGPNVIRAPDRTATTLYLTHNAGSAAFAAATTKVVAHGLDGTPRTVGVAPQANRTMWVTAADGTNFTVNAAASNSDSFYWEASL